MAVDPELYRGIHGIDGDGYLETDASQMEVGGAIGALRAETFEADASGLVRSFLIEHGLPEGELGDALLGLMKTGLSVQSAVERRIPLPKYRPVEGQLEINDLITDAADVIPVNPAHRHFMQPATGRVLDELEEAGVITSDTRSDAHLPIFRALVDASDLGYRAKAIEHMNQ